MKALIKSHRRSASLDSSPTKSPRARDSQRTINEPSSPAQFGLYSSEPLSHGPRHSSSFESLPKLSNKNKIFTTKLFKKSSNSSSNLSKPGTNSGTPTSYTFKQFPSPDGNSPSTFERGLQKTPRDTNVERFPAIKGTRTHEWGEISEGSQSVIVLNRSSLSSDMSSDAGDPGISANARSQRESVSTAASSSVSNTRRSSYDSQTVPTDAITKLKDINEIKEKHPYFSLRSNSNKSKNRQFQIHSHDDIISLGKQSGISLECLSSNFNSYNGVDSSPNLSEPTSRPGLTFGSDSQMIGLGLTIEKCDSLRSKPESSESSINELKNLILNDRSFEEGDELFLTGKTEQADSKGEESFEDEENSSDEYSSDDSSKFSFEINGINGRTSSVKYYSKPQPTNNVYVDDLYDDEEFDDEVNYCDDEDVDFAEDDTVHLFNRNYFKDNKEIETKGLPGLENQISDDNSKFEEHAGNVHNVKRYGDICKMSDEESISSQADYEDCPVKKVNKVSCYGDFFDLSDDENSNAERIENDVLPSKIEDRNLSRDNHLQGLNSYEDVQATQPETDKRITSRINPKGEEISKSDEVCSQNYLGRTTSPISFTVTTCDGNVLRSPFAHTTSPAASEAQSIPSALLPPRSHSLKYHDISSNLDNEVPGAMSNLYFIDETEEDRYNKENQSDDHYLDEINDIPEDFSFSEGDDEYLLSPSKTPDPRVTSASFKRTHSFSEKPVNVLKEKSPIRYKLELKNKTVTFFNNHISRSISDSAMYNMTPEADTCSLKSPEAETLPLSPLKSELSPITPSNSFSRPSPYFSQGNSLSPIQESNSSVDNSPKIVV